MDTIGNNFVPNNKFPALFPAALDAPKKSGAKGSPKERVKLTDQELITRYSKLDEITKKTSDVFWSLTLVELLCNICLSPFSQGLSFEGLSSLDGLLWLRSALSVNSGFFISQNKVEKKLSPAIQAIDQLIDQLEAANRQTVVEQAKKAKDKILALHPGESYSLPSGYFGQPAGHAMILRVKCCKQGLFDLYLYNAQEGSSEMQGGKVSPEREDTIPYLKFGNVPQEELFFDETPLILEQIYGLKRPVASTKQLSNDSVLSALSPIAHHLVSPERLPQLFISTQRSGDCVIKSFNCLLLDLFGKTKLYKRTTLEIRLQTLVSSYEAFLHSVQAGKLTIEEKEQALFMLRQAVRSFSGLVDRRHRSGMITEEGYLHAIGTTLDLMKRLGGLQESWVTPSAEIPPQKSKVEGLEEEAQLRKTSLAQIAMPQLQPPAVVLDPIAGVACDLGVGASWSDLDKVMNTLQEIQGQKGLSPLDAQLQYEITFQNLRGLKNDPDGLEALNFNDCNKVLTSLRNQLNGYIDLLIQKMKKDSLYSPAVHNTAMEMLVMGYLLACRADRLRPKGNEKGFLGNFSLWAEHFETISDLEGYQSEDPLAFAHGNELRAWLAGLRKEKTNGLPLFNFTAEINEDLIFSGRRPEAEYLIRVVPQLSAQPNALKKTREQNLQELQDRNGLLRWLFTQRMDSLNLDQYSMGEFSHYFRLSDMAFSCCAIFFHTKNIVTQPVNNIFLFGKDSFATRYFTIAPMFLAISDAFSNMEGKTKIYSGKLAFPNDFLTKKRNRSPQSTNSPKWEEEGRAENRFITTTIDNSPLNDFARSCTALTAPEVTIAILFDDLANHPDLFNSAGDSPVRNFLFHKVLKSGASQNSSPLFTAIEKDPHFLKRLDAVALATCSYFSQPANRKKALPSLLFNCRLMAKCLRYYQIIHANDPNFMMERSFTHLNEVCQLLRDCLREGGENDGSEKELLLALTGLLLMVPASQRTPQSEAEVFFLMNQLRCVQKYSESPSTDTVFEIEMCRYYLQTLSSRMVVWTQAAFLSSFLESLSSRFYLPSGQPRIEGNLLMTRSADDDVSFDLALFQVRRNGVLIQQSPQSLKFTDDYQRLFGNIQPANAVEESSQYLFSHPRWGKIQLTLSDKREPVAIEREIEGVWYLYGSPKKLLSDPSIGWNIALGYDHVTWVSRKAPHDTIVSDLKSGQILYRVDRESGVLFRVSDGAAVSLNGLDGNPLGDALAKFDSSGHILLLETKTGPVVQLPRFQGKDGLPLEFFWKEGQWWYRLDPHFRLDFSSPFSWNIDRCLQLVSLDGSKRRVLVPLGEATSQEYLPHTHIDLSPGDTDNNKGSLSYCSFQVEGGALYGLSPVEHLYLAHLFLAQKNYQKAFFHLRRLSMSDSLDQKGVELLSALVLQTTANRHKDHSPNASAVRLHAYTMLKDLGIEASNLVFEEASSCYGIYLRSVKNIEQTLKISQTEHELLEQNFPGRLRRASYSSSSKVHWNIHPDLKEGGLNSLLSSEVHNCLKWWETFIQSCSHKFEEYYKSIDSSESPLELIQWAYRIAYGKGSALAKRENNFLLLTIKMKLTQGNIPKYERLSSGLSWQTFCSAFKIYSGQQNTDPISARWSVKSVGLAREPSKIDKEIFSQSFDLLTGAKPIDPELELADRFLVNPPVQDVMPPLDLPAPTLQLSKGEKLYQGAISAHLAHYQKDQKIAQDIQAHENRERQLKDGVTVDQLKSALSEALTASEAREKRLEKQVIKLANQEIGSLPQIVHRKAQKMARSKVPIAMAKICQAAVDPDWFPKLHKLNRTLSNEEIKQLRLDCLDYMVAVTQREQEVRILEAFNTWQRVPEDESLKEEFLVELSFKRNYDPRNEKMFFYLYVEYKSGLRLRRKQLSLITGTLEKIKKGENPPPFQLIMGGGKTSMILSTVLEILAEQGKLACALCHHSQYASLRGNLQEFQKNRYGKDVITLHATMKELSDEKKLRGLIDRIQVAKRDRCPLLIPSTFPQLLLAKFKKDCLSVTDSVPATLYLLAKLIELLKINSVALIDECDSTLSMMTEVRVPVGDSSGLPPDEAELIGWLYQQMVSPELKELCQLLSPLREELPPDHGRYPDEILPALVKRWMKDPSFNLPLPAHLKPAMVRYMEGKIGAKTQQKADSLKDFRNLSAIDQEDIELLRYLQGARKSESKTEKRSAELVGVMRHVLQSILPTALSRSYNKHYGPVGGEDVGEVVPYQGVGTPATTKFGNPYLALALSIQSSVGATIASTEIAFLAQKMRAVAEEYALLEEKEIHETLEGVLFKSLTGVELGKIATSMEEAVAFVNDLDHPERKIALRAEVSPFHVRYFTEEVYCTPIDLVELFPVSVAFSGTLYNHSSFHRKLGPPLLDKGTEGSILNRMIERKIPLIESKDTSLPSLLSSIADYDKKEQVRAPIDSGGYLKQQDNEEIAQQILKKLDHIEGVIYLPKGASSFYLMKRSGELIRLENTSRKEIEQYISLEKLAVLFDELRTTGTDIPLAADSICFQTIHPKMPIRAFLQGALRPREFFKNQKIQPIISSQARKELNNQGETLQDLFFTLEKNEAIAISNQAMRSYEEQFADAPRRPLINQLLKAAVNHHPSALVNLRNKTELFSSRIPNQYEAFSRIQTLETSEVYLKSLNEKAKSKGANCDDLLKAALENPMRPGQLPINSTGPVDHEIQLEQELELNLQQEQEVNLELNQEVQLELEAHNQEFFEAISCPEKVWPYQSLNLENTLPLHLPLDAFFKGKFLGNVSLTKYADCFPAHLHISDNLRRVKEGQELPSVFHRTFKETHFILLLKEGQNFHAVMLSKWDADCLKKVFQQHAQENSWLIGLNGIPVIETATPPPLDTLGCQELLWYANVFNGNIHYLQQHEELSQLLLGKNRELLSKYVLLKNGFRPKRWRHALQSSLFELDVGIRRKQKNTHFFSARRKELDNRYNATRKLMKEKVANLDPRDVPSLSSLQIPWLTTTAQLDRVPDEKIKDLTLEQIPLLSVKKIKKCLSKNLLSQKQVQQIPTDKLPNPLLKPILLRLSAKQLSELGEERIIKDSQEMTEGEAQQLDPVEQELLILQIAQNNSDWLRADQLKSILENRRLEDNIVSQLRVDQLPQNNIPGYVMGLVDLNKVKATEPAHWQAGASLADNQIGQLTAEDAKWLPFVPDEKLDALAALQPDLIRHVSDERTGLVNDDLLIDLFQKNSLTQRQVQAVHQKLLSQPLAAETTKNILLHLNHNQLEAVEEDKVVHGLSVISEQEVKQLDPVRQERLILQVAQHKISWLQAHQLHFPLEKQQLRNETVSQLRVDQLPPNNIPDYVMGLVDLNKVKATEPADWQADAVLADDQIRQLRAEDAKWLPFVPDEKLDLLAASQADLIQHLSDERTALLLSKALPPEETKNILLHLNQNQLEAVKQDKLLHGLSVISEEEVKHLDPIEQESLILPLPDEKIPWLQAGQVEPILDKKRFSDRVIKQLRADQLPQDHIPGYVMGLLELDAVKATEPARWEQDASLAENQIRQLTNEDVKWASWIPGKLLHRLSNGVLEEFIKVKTITEQQIGGIEAQELSEDQIRALAEQLSDRQIQSIEVAYFPKELSSHTIARLSSQQAKELFGAKGFFQHLGYPLYGLVLTTLSLALLPFQLVYNVMKFLLFMTTFRALLLVIKRRFLPFIAIFSYPSYRVSVAKMEGNK